LDLSLIFRDGRAPKGLPYTIKRSPKTASGFPNLKGTFGVWGTQTTQNEILGLKMVKYDSLPKSIKIINCRDFLRKFVKNADNPPEGSTEIGFGASLGLRNLYA